MLAKINAADVFVRRPGKIIGPASNNTEEVTVQYSDSKGVIKNNLNKSTAENLFTKDGITNDYLKTCKNSQRKTVFDIFKEG